MSANGVGGRRAWNGGLKMTSRRWLVVVVSGIALAGAALHAADITGTWTASFDTQIGQQNYTYEFAVEGSTLTGTAKSANGEYEIQDGKVDGDTVTFVENMKFQGMDIRIEYTGTVVSDDEITFTRKVGDFATEELGAKRKK
jgi:hypothetical protein